VETHQEQAMPRGKFKGGASKPCWQTSEQDRKTVLLMTARMPGLHLTQVRRRQLLHVRTVRSGHAGEMKETTAAQGLSARMVFHVLLKYVSSTNRNSSANTYRSEQKTSG
jgi:hypothetical protein